MSAAVRTLAVGSRWRRSSPPWSRRVLVVGAAASGYVVRAQFTDASQLVNGDLVEVGGRKVGEVTAIDLTDDNLAEVDADARRRQRHAAAPGHARGGPHASACRASPTASSTCAPGPRPRPRSPTAASCRTDAHARRRRPRRAAQQLRPGRAPRRPGHHPRHGDGADAGRPPSRPTPACAMLNPAVVQLTELGPRADRDQAALRGPARATRASVSGVLARHRDGARRRASTRPPACSRRSPASATALGRRARARARGAARDDGGRCAALRTRTLPVLDPVLRDLRPVDRAARRAAAQLVRPTLADARPLLAEPRAAACPQARARARAAARLQRRRGAGDGVDDQGAAATRCPSCAACGRTRPTSSPGFFHGFGGSTAHTYDANGHYARIMLHGRRADRRPGSLPRAAGGKLGGLRTRLDARCPGAAEEPAPDGSNPWPEGAGRARCDPRHNQ